MARKRKRKEQEADEVGFGEASAPEDRQRLTPIDVQEKVFRLAFRGYSERDVDEFLDRITEDLAALHEENKRLREQLAEGGGTPGGTEDAERQAEAIVRQAREHAARLVEEAEARAESAGAAASGGPDPLPTSFLLRERQFLQQMAALIQTHVRRLKEEARRAGTAPGEASGGPEGEAEPGVEARPQTPPPGTSTPPPPPPPAQPQASEGGSIAEAASQPEERSILLPEAPEERTAPWAQVEEPEGRDEDQDPLLSAWESAFAAETRTEPGDEAALYPSEVRNRKDDEEEPSLRELFWGDEG